MSRLLSLSQVNFPIFAYILYLYQTVEWSITWWGNFVCKLVIISQLVTVAHRRAEIRWTIIIIIWSDFLCLLLFIIGTVSQHVGQFNYASYYLATDYTTFLRQSWWHEHRTYFKMFYGGCYCRRILVTINRLIADQTFAKDYDYVVPPAHPPHQTMRQSSTLFK